MKCRSNLFLAAAFAVTLVPAGQAFAVVVTDWTFQNQPVGLDNFPTPAIGAGTAQALGMTNPYQLTKPGPPVTNFTLGSTNMDDLTLTGGSSTFGALAAADASWRVRGGDGTAALGQNTGNGTGNGWSLSAPERTQGAEFDVSTAGFSNIVFQYDWFSTNQGVKNQVAQYTINGGATWTDVVTSISVPAITPFMVATQNGFNNNVTINFATLNIHTVDNNAQFGIRLVSVHDPALGVYGSADGAQAGVYNNNSGNWRFDNVIVSGAAIVPEPASVVLAGFGFVALLFHGLRRKFAK